MSKKILAIVGATGQQGASIIDHVLGSPSLSAKYTVRALTRNTSSSAAQDLSRRGVEIASADVDEPSTLGPALTGAYTVISITITKYASDTYDHEVANGKAIADAAVAAGAQLLVFSTLPSTLAISNGKYRIAAFDAKTEIEKYIRRLPLTSAFFAPGVFMENYTGASGPRKNESGQYVIANINSADTLISLIATRRDVGKFVGLLLDDPEKYSGKVLKVAVQNLSWTDIAKTMTKVTGKEVVHQQVTEDVFASFFPNEARATNIGNMYKLFEDFSYYGEDIEVPEALKTKVADFETFLREVSFSLD
jgi:uncharacterized protein YbjT (DUF2867 family)